MNGLQVRRATAGDADGLVDVYRSASRENRQLGFPARAESVTKREVVDWIRSGRVGVAAVDGAAVGGVRLEATGPDRVKLSRLGVHERWKGTGIGSGLLDHVHREAGDCGYAVVWLTTPENTPELYRCRGYEVTGEYPLDHREYDEVVMEKRLR